MAITKLSDTYYEIIDSESPTRAVFNNKESYSVVTYLIEQNQIITFIEDVLGYSKLQNNTYVARPKLPASHPIFPWMYASGIMDLKGYSVDGRESSVTCQNRTSYSDIDVLKPPYTGSYAQYKVTVKYQAREYAIYDDEQLRPLYEPNAVTYMPYKVENEPDADWTERQEKFNNRLEYTRFTNWTWTPEIEYLTYGGGNYWMKKGTDRDPAEIAEIPVSMEQGGTNFLKIVRSKINLNWFMVPFEWSVNNQILQDAYSKINYETFMFFPKGSLLFKELEIQKYDPQWPFLKIDLTVNSSVYDYFTQFNKNQYCDVIFKFIYMNYPDGTRSATNPQLYFPLQVRDVNSFHNRAIGPATRLWYYCDSKPAIPVENARGEQVGWTPDRSASPIYWSYNFKNLVNYREGP